jgi:hypothetical protein
MLARCLPARGEGDRACAVVGAVGLSGGGVRLRAPSTMLRMVPLPMLGRHL